VCDQSIYQFGWHFGLWGKGQNKRATWHAPAATPGNSGMHQANAAAAGSGQHCVKEFSPTIHRRGRDILIPQEAR
jgi:hypothetical protein